MASQHYDYIIVGGGSAGCALANRLSADPAHRVLVLEAGRPDYLWDVFIHMPAALTIPIGSRFYDWKYESEPEPHMNGRRISHARGKVLGGSSSINGMIFQRGNPLDYERWAGRPGHGRPGTTRTACRTSRRWRTAWPARTSYRGDDRPAGARARPGDEPAVRRVLRGSAAGRLPADRRRQRLPAGGLRGVRPQRAPGTAAVRGPRVPASRHAAARTWRSRCRASSSTGSCSRESAPSGVEYPPRRGAGPGPRAGEEIILCGGAINSPQLLQLSGIGTRGELEPWASTWCGPARRRREPAGPPGGLRPARVEAAGLGGARAEVAQPAHDRRRMAVRPQRARRDQPLRGRRVPAEQRGRRLPEPDVPLPADRDPLRRLGTGRRATATRCTSGRCTPTPAAR